MQIETGKKYLTAEGVEIGPMEKHHVRDITTGDVMYRQEDMYWSKDGRQFFGYWNEKGQCRFFVSIPMNEEYAHQFDIVGEVG